MMSGAPVEFFGWFQRAPLRWKRLPWLVLGKGPTFSKLDAYDTSNYNLFGLNHVVRECRIDIAHAIDIEVIRDCSELLLDRAEVVLMPWLPHVACRPGPISLDHWCQKIPVLAELAKSGRLLWYNRSGSPRHGGAQVVKVKYFSAEAPYSILGAAGIKQIRSLGVDGGGSYSPAFANLGTLLANGRSSFDSQFGEIAKSIFAHDLDAAPLDVESPIRVYVAASEEKLLPVKVLEFSIRRRSSITATVVPLNKTSRVNSLPDLISSRIQTSYALQRFLVPEAAAFSGRAIFLESDMQVMGDIRELWCADMAGHKLLSAAPYSGSKLDSLYSVMLLDCSRLHWEIVKIIDLLNEGQLDYEELTRGMRIVDSKAALLPPEWNCVEHFVSGTTKLIHYDDLEMQPWIRAGHPFGHVWVAELIAAVREGFITIEEVRMHAMRGWVRPSLVHQVEKGIEDCALLPPSVLALDRHFSPPQLTLPQVRIPLLHGYPRYLFARTWHALVNCGKLLLRLARFIRARSTGIGS